jgi:hypothetical protein
MAGWHDAGILSTNFETLASSDLNVSSRPAARDPTRQQHCHTINPFAPNPQGEQAERLLDITVALVAASDANLRQEAANLLCARVEISLDPPDAVVRALELGLRSTSDASVQLFTVELLTDFLDQAHTTPCTTSHDLCRTPHICEATEHVPQRYSGADPSFQTPATP